MLKLNVSRWLIDDADRWWKFASTRLAIAGGVVVTAVVADPSIIQHTLDALPADLRPLVPPAIGTIATVLPIVVRLWKQVPAPQSGPQS